MLLDELGFVEAAFDRDVEIVRSPVHAVNVDVIVENGSHLQLLDLEEDFHIIRFE